MADDLGKWNEFWPIGSNIISSNESSENENRNITRDDIKRYQLLASFSSKNKTSLPMAFKVIIKHEQLGLFERVILL